VAGPYHTADAAPTAITECQIITEPGSYELVNNLPGPGGPLNGLDCLVVGADNVTIDLAGFVIDGFAGTGAIFGRGITQDVTLERTGVHVRNGTITNFFLAGVYLPATTDGTIDEVRVISSNQYGIWVGDDFTITHSIVDGGSVTGIHAGEDSVVTG